MLILSPASTTTYRIEAANTTGTSIEIITLTVLSSSSLGVAIQSPIASTSLNLPQTIVQGIVTTSADEVGVVVNGYPAQVNGNRWFVNNLPLVEGDNSITVTATQPDGATASHSIPVSVDTSVPIDWIELHLSPESGIAPLNSYLKVEPHLSFTPTTWNIGTIGPAQDVTMQSTSDTEHELTFPTPGFYTIIFTMSDDQGNETSGEIMVDVIDGVMLEELLNLRWNAMTTDLLAGNSESALGYFVAASQDKYRTVFTTLGSSKLNSIFSGSGNISIDVSYGKTAKCGINRVESNQTYSYPLTMIKDENGLWKITGF
jgi:hypothetical protein